MDRQFLQHWWQQHELGRYLCQQEHHFVQNCVNMGQFQRVLCVGMDLGVFRLPEDCDCWLRQDTVLPADVLADGLKFPWQAQSFDCVVAVHELDCVGDDWQMWLADIWRILQANGRLILMGFNPYSLWRLSEGQNAPMVRQSLRLSVLKTWLLSHGWKIEQGQFLNYLPPVRSMAWLQKWQFLEYVGNRWLPHGAAVYALVLRKDVLGVHPCDERCWVEGLAGDAMLAWARDELK